MRKLVLLALLLLPIAALGENLDLKYEAFWAGIRAGRAEVQVTETSDGYKSHVRAEADGIVKRITKYWTDNTITGKLLKSMYQPGIYDSQWQPKKAEPQRVVVTYGKNGEVSEIATPPENRGKRPEVAAKDKNDLLDPITAGLEVRQKVRGIIESGAKLPQKFTIRIFDSRRVTDLNFDIIGYENVKLNGISQKLLKIAFGRAPVVGYNAKELKKHEEQNPPINIYADENYIPVMASGKAVIGEVSIKLVK